MLLWLLLPVVASALEEPEDFCQEPEELLFLEFLEQVRADPGQTAQDLGLDLEDLFEQRPEMEFLLQQELPALEQDDRLCRAAYSHSQDMLQNGYFSFEGLDGSMPEDRLLRQGYAPVQVWEDLGLVGFKNFLGAERATAALFSQMFLHELQYADLSQPGVLNPWFRHKGLGIAKGWLQAESYTGNAYISTLDLAAGEDVLLELKLIKAINQARQDPQAAWSRLDTELQTKELSGRSLNPVARSAELTDIARSMGRNVLDNNGQDLDYEDSPEYFKMEFALLRALPGASVQDLAEQALENLLQAELEAMQQDAGPFIFDSDLKAIGIGVFELNPEERDFLFVVLMDQGTDEDYLLGQILYADQEGQDREADLESRDGLRIYLSSLDQSSLLGFAVSGPEGFYQLRIPEGLHPFKFFDFRLEDSTGKLLGQERVFLHRDNQILDIVVDNQAKDRHNTVD